jgi:nitrogenase subunit NifH
MTDSCITTVTDKILVFSENKSEFRIENDNQRKIEKHKVDDCLIKGNEFLKCDWLAVDVETKKEVYIELKGEGVKHAVNQILSSVEKLTKDKKSKKLGYVICTRSPLNSTEIQTLTKQVGKQFILRVKTKQHTENIEKLIEDLSK